MNLNQQSERNVSSSLIELGEVKKGDFHAWPRASQGSHAWIFRWLKEMEMTRING